MKLREIRKQRNKTQVEIAAYLNINQEKYSRIESEKSKIDVETLIQLSDYYKVSVDELIGHKIPYLIDKSLLSNEELAIISEIKNLDTMQRIKVLAYIDGMKDSKEKQDSIIKKFEER